jgi:hypothetical protein
MGSAPYTPNGWISKTPAPPAPPTATGRTWAKRNRFRIITRGQQAAAKDLKDVAEALLASKALVNAKTNDGDTSRFVQVLTPTKTGGNEILRDGEIVQFNSNEPLELLEKMR